MFAALYGVRPHPLSPTTSGRLSCPNVRRRTDYGTITKDSLVGTWEHIKLEYFYGQQNSATALTLHANGTMSGSLTVAGVSMHLKSNLPWVTSSCVWNVRWMGANPRRVTLVYAGTEKNLNATYWGKKSK